MPALWLYQNQNCNITLALAQSLPCQNQSLFNLYFYLLCQLLHLASNHCFITLCRSHQGTHIYFPNQITVPESFRIILTGTSSSPSHHILHQHTPFFWFTIFSGSRLISSSATITRYVVPGWHWPIIEDHRSSGHLLRSILESDRGGYQYHNSLPRINVWSRWDSRAIMVCHQPSNSHTRYKGSSWY